MQFHYYQSILNQVYENIGKTEGNLVLVKCGTEFSVKDFEIPGKIKENQDILFWAGEYEGMVESYEPFLSIIGELFLSRKNQDFSEFMKVCGVYELHKPIFESYLKTGVCKRKEDLLLTEAEYERERLEAAVCEMLLCLTAEKPLLLFLNRVQMAAQNTVRMLQRLNAMRGTKNIGILLGVYEVKHLPDELVPVWEAFEADLAEQGKIFRVGTMKNLQKETLAEEVSGENPAEVLRILKNQACFMDYEQACVYLKSIERRIRFENVQIPPEELYELYKIYAYVSMCRLDLPKAQEICGDIRRINDNASERKRQLFANQMTAEIFMYQGRLEEAKKKVQEAKGLAWTWADEKEIFHLELLQVQIQMSGWYNIFFCTQNIEVNERLLSQLRQYGYDNHLAYIYIYAFDNESESIARAGRDGGELKDFYKGIGLAQKIGNEHLIYSAYQKNIMLASTNGMPEIAIWYWIKIFESIQERISLEGGRVCSGLGYNLSALGRNKEAGLYFEKAVQIFYEKNLPEDIAEVFYNQAVNQIAMQEYDRAVEDLTKCMHTIEKLRLNSLRVCNLSKLYALLALCCQKIGKHFSSEQYLNSCKKFLSYVLDKEDDKSGGMIYDFAKCDDDLFLYYYALALTAESQQDAKAGEYYESAESHLKKAEGNEFFCYEDYRRDRSRFFKKQGNEQAAEGEEALRHIFAQKRRESREKMQMEALVPVEDFLIHGVMDRATQKDLEILLNQESLVRAYLTKKRQLNFIAVWQRLIGVTDSSAEQMVERSMAVFLNHFAVDRAVYIQYHNQTPKILFNNTDCILSTKKFQLLLAFFQKNPDGFSASKAGGSYAKYQDVIAVFGEENVCSMAAVPFMNSGRVESILITYVLMKDNWHSSMNRYMLNEDDKNMFELLFRELSNALNRLYAYEKIFEMNAKLFHSAVTDSLTGLLNRKGFYQQMEDVLSKEGKEHSFGLMFIDLDNFKQYNDSFGHEAGDLILKEMGEIFQKTAGKQGIAARFGGDEFLILFLHPDKEFLKHSAEEIYAAIRKKKGFVRAIEAITKTKVFILEGKELSCSIGISVSKEVSGEDEINKMIKQADDLLYVVKSSAKGTYRFEENY